VEHLGLERLQLLRPKIHRLIFLVTGEGRKRKRHLSHMFRERNSKKRKRLGVDLGERIVSLKNKE
jgi:hypothetical protein